MIRLLALVMLLLAAPVTAQNPVSGIPAFRTVPAPFVWAPTADYVTIGQDEPGYRRWMAARPWRPAVVSGFHQYLANAGVAYVLPTWQLLRTASDWHRCAAEPFEIPPASQWPNLVGALRYIQAYVVPAIGPVEAVSVYRNPALNACAGGAPESAHRHMFAIDMVPLRPTTREAMIDTLCAAHAYQGSRYGVGLGFYTKFRFHVDTWKFRRWGRDSHGGAACAPTLARLHIPEPRPLPAVIQPVSSATISPAPIDSSVETIATDPLAPMR